MDGWDIRFYVKDKDGTDILFSELPMKEQMEWCRRLWTAPLEGLGYEVKQKKENRQ